MVIDIDIATAITAVGALAAAWWGMARMMFAQFERRQDERFKNLGKTLTEHKVELDDHMKRQDAVIADVRRVETQTNIEIRRVESELSRHQVDCASRFQTKDDAGKAFIQLVEEIRALSARIDTMISRGREQ